MFEIKLIEHGPSGANIVGGNDKTFIGRFLAIYQILWLLGLYIGLSFYLVHYQLPMNLIPGI